VIILVIFGPSKLGEVGGTLGRAIRDFKSAMNETNPSTPAKSTQVEAKPSEPKA
jgi:sec-independent protein translocase protein TatA